MTTHEYRVRVSWEAPDGVGTRDYRSYHRDHIVAVEGKPPILASSDPAFRGDASRYNPEELLVASLSSCHMLWYLHLCAIGNVVVTGYRDLAVGELHVNADGSGQFTRVALHPEVTISASSDESAARTLHEEAHRLCFIARSVTFPVVVEATSLRGEAMPPT
jgi:organic hydroperoxide reductase OsmC/OhrA